MTDEEELICSVCGEDTQEDAQLCPMCGDDFCVECVDSWFEERACNNCTADLDDGGMGWEDV